MLRRLRCIELIRSQFVYVGLRGVGRLQLSMAKAAENGYPIPKIHTKCCSKDETFYCNDPAVKVKRAPVRSDQIPWNVDFPGYTPVEYTDEKIVKNPPPPWADPDIRRGDNSHKIKFNAVDGSTDRRSHHGVYKLSKDGLPLNPVGRTGMTGRGRLGKWGPNHAADSIVTRWKKENGKIKCHDTSKNKVLEFIAIVRRDNSQYAIPGGMVDAGEHISITLKREFSEEALNSLAVSNEKKAQIREQVDKLFHKGGVEIYKGYVDDPRNTDNAWMETEAYHFHDEDGTSVGSFRLDAGDDATGVRWMVIDQSLNLYASHRDFIQKAAERLGAHWSSGRP